MTFLNLIRLMLQIQIFDSKKTKIRIETSKSDFALKLVTNMNIHGMIMRRITDCVIRMQENQK